MSLIRSISRRFSGARRGDTSRKKEPVTLADQPSSAIVKRDMKQIFSDMKASSTQSTDVERTLYEIPQPSNVDAMTDLIKGHADGDLFPYVGVVGNEGESSDARRARMLAIKPSHNKRDIPEIKILGCPLISREGQFSMESLMAHAKANTETRPPSNVPLPSGAHAPDYNLVKPYVHVRQITVIFTPNVSSTSNYCTFSMSLIDQRLINSEKGSQSNTIVSNQEGILEMSCDYCVSINDLNSFIISYTLARDIVQPGFQWGTASFYFSITESDLPYQSSKVDAMAVYRMPITTLLERQTNADRTDISFTPTDLVALRALYSKGDIVDVDEPKKDRMKKSAYSRTTLRGAAKGEEIDTQDKPGWEFMKGARKPQVDAMEASVDEPESTVGIPEPADDADMRRERAEAIKRYKMLQEEERARQNLNLNLSEKMLAEGSRVASVESVEDEEALGIGTMFQHAKGKKQVGFSASQV